VILTLTIPYSLVTKIIASPNIVIPQSQKALFAEGLKNTYRWLAVLNTIAIFPSALRGKRAKIAKSSVINESGDPSGTNSPESTNSIVERN
jgi:hypothetical protein